MGMWTSGTLMVFRSLASNEELSSRSAKNVCSPLMQTSRSHCACPRSQLPSWCKPRSLCSFQSPNLIYTSREVGLVSVGRVRLMCSPRGTGTGHLLCLHEPKRHHQPPETGPGWNSPQHRPRLYQTNIWEAEEEHPWESSVLFQDLNLFAQERTWS